MRTVATWINLAAATLVAVGVFLQVYFIAAFFTGAGETALDLHEGIGGLIHLLEALVFLSGLVAFWGAWRWVGWSFLLLVLGTVQIMLSPSEDPGSGWVHGLHGLGALFVLILASFIVHHDLRTLGLMRPREATPMAGPPPQPPA